MTQKQLLKHVNSKISNTQNQQLIKKIEITEIQQALHTMENGKLPGIDGIPVEFYKEFFDLFKKNLQDIFNNVLFCSKTTPNTWNQAIITLILKKPRKPTISEILETYIFIMHRLQNTSKNFSKLS